MAPETLAAWCVLGIMVGCTRTSTPVAVLRAIAKSLNGVAEFTGHFDIHVRHLADALHEYVVAGHARVEANGGKNGDLRSGVEPVYICRRVGFGIACRLSRRKHFVKGQAFLLHAGKNVVGGAVHDAGNGQNFVAYQVVLQGVHHGNAASRCRFAFDLHVVLRGQRTQAFHVAAEQRFVGGNHMLARLERFFENLSCRVFAADEFDHDVNLRVAYHLAPIVGEALGDP